MPDGSTLHILRGLDLAVHRGEVVAIVGRSGSGKTTLLNIVGLLDVPDSGTYSVDGRDLTTLRDSEAAALRGTLFGFVFQNFSLLDGRTAEANVAAPLLYAPARDFRARHQLARTVLTELGLGERLRSYPSQLSGGEQQRVAIARSLIRRPRVVLADEPTGSLDVDTADDVMGRLLRAARDHDCAVLLITHDSHRARQCDRRLTLADGVLRAA